MFYIKYLSVMFRKNKQIYLRMIIIIIMSVMLLTVVTIYRDSDAYGTETQIKNITKGAEYHISGAKADDIIYFEGITHGNIVYEDGLILISMGESDNNNLIRETINAIIEENKLINLTVTDYHRYFENSVPDGLIIVQIGRAHV